MTGDRRLALRYPAATRGEVVVWGLLAGAPYGGMTWQVLHHLAGLRRLGFDVWYVEDSDRMLTDPVTYWPTMEHARNVEHLARWMDAIGLGDRWAFRLPGRDEYLGALDRAGVERLYARVDAAFNLCACQELRPRHDALGCLVLLETDPVFKQIAASRGRERSIAELSRHHHLFTYGTNLYGDDCTVPVPREFTWHVTRPPVVVDWWATDEGPPPGAPLTTVANWKHTDRDIEWEGARLRWTKHRQFARHWDLPTRAPAPVEVALRGADEEERQMLLGWGWRLRAAEDLADPHAYRDYVRSSLGELSFAKELVVDTRSGWLSDRTVCYLAAGRPAVVQDTGARAPLVPGDGGLRTFADTDAAVEQIAEITGDIATERKRAEELARSVFDAEVVLREMCDTIGLG